MILGIFISVFVYSFVLTIYLLYKDYSSYFTAYDLDLLFAGPVAWIFGLVLLLLSPLIKKINKKQKKQKKQKLYTSSQIESTVKKIIKKYKKQSQNYKDNFIDYFDFSSYSGHYDNTIYGWRDLLVCDWKNERLNKRFEHMMFYQKEETLTKLIPYFQLLTEEEMDDIFYFDNHKIKIYKIKEEL